MICSKCGTMVPDEYEVCPRCGNIMQAAAPQYQAPPQPQYAPPQPQYVPYVEATPVNPAEPPVSSTSILVFGILALAFCETPFLGLIFGAIAKKKGKKYLAQNGILAGKAKVGNLLGTIGFIINIVLTIIEVLCIIGYILVAVGLFGMAMSGGYY